MGGRERSRGRQSKSDLMRKDADAREGGKGIKRDLLSDSVCILQGCSHGFPDLSSLLRRCCDVLICPSPCRKRSALFILIFGQVQ